MKALRDAYTQQTLKAYRIVDDDEPEFSSAMPLEEGDTFFFAPRQLRNLVLVDELESLSPILGCHIADLGESTLTLRQLSTCPGAVTLKL